MMKSFSQCAFSLHKCNQLRFVQHQSALLRRIKKCSPTSFQCKIILNVDYLSEKSSKKKPLCIKSIVLHYIIVHVNISHTSLYAMYDITVFNSSNNAVNNKFVNIHILFYCTTISYVIVLLYDNLHTINQENKTLFTSFHFFCNIS